MESAEILEMNGYYQTLVASMHKWSQDASILLHGEAVFFLDLPTVQVLFCTAYSSFKLGRETTDYITLKSSDETAL